MLSITLSAFAADDSIVVSRKLCSGLWIVPLTWQGEGKQGHELTALFDTGGFNLLIDPDSLERVSGRRIREGRRVRMEDVSASGLDFSTFRPRVREMSHLGAALGMEFDIFLPYRAFEGRLLVLDYPNLEMRIEKGELPEPDGRYVFSSNGPDERPWLRVELPDRSRRLLIDSGSGGRLALKRPYGLTWLAPPVLADITARFDGNVMRRAGRAAERITIGNLEFNQPIVAITRQTELIGAEVMRHFALSFDITNERVRLDPQTQGPVHFDSRRGTGALVRADEGGFFEIEHVIADSPAARAGLVTGDRITEVDGVPVAERGCRSLDAPERASIVFGIQRASGIETIELEQIDIIK